MKKMNEKGLTLTELIVSFAIVGVAMIYFFETLYTVRRLYTVSQTETQTFVDEDYVLRLTDAYFKKNCVDNKCNASSNAFYEDDGYKIYIGTKGKNKLKYYISDDNTIEVYDVSYDIKN